jgi:hypothetical protein
LAKTENSYGPQHKNPNTNCLRGFCETGNNLILLDPLKQIRAVASDCESFLVMNTYTLRTGYGARILNLFRSPRFDSVEPIPPGCVAWRAGTTTLFLLGSYPPIDCLKIPAQELDRRVTWMVNGCDKDAFAILL